MTFLFHPCLLVCANDMKAVLNTFLKPQLCKRSHSLHFNSRSSYPVSGQRTHFGVKQLMDAHAITNQLPLPSFGDIFRAALSQAASSRLTQCRELALGEAVEAAWNKLTWLPATTGQQVSGRSLELQESERSLININTSILTLGRHATECAANMSAFLPFILRF